MHAGFIQYRIFQVLVMPSSVTGNLSFVRIQFLKGWVKSPQMLLIFLSSFFCRGPSLFCLSLHMTHKAVSFQLSLKEGWLRKMQSCAFPDHDSILKTRNISGLSSVLFSWMHVKGWRAGFLPPLPDSLLPKSQGLWFDRQTETWVDGIGEERMAGCS